MVSMPVVELIRLEDNKQFGTFGVLKINKNVFCVTLEPPDELNKKGKSSIPTGQYVCEKYISPRFGSTYQVLDVPDRDYILFHPGNTVYDTEGCIVLGQYFGKLRENRAVLNSGNTFRTFLVKMNEHNNFILTISEVY